MFFFGFAFPQRHHILILLLVAPGLIFVSPTHGKNTQQGGCVTASYEDRNADGSPETLALVCSFATNRDLIHIFDRNSDLDPDIHWEENLDYENDIWVFDAGGDGKANLIIDFHKIGENIVADIFDDQTGDAQVAFEEKRPGQILVQENETPTVQVTAQEGWWTETGQVNYNLEIAIDGDMWSSFGSEVYTDYLSTDGSTDVLIEVHDLDRDGKPDIEVRHLPDVVELSPDLARYSGRATQVMVNWLDDELPVNNYLFWPHLGSHDDPLKHYGISEAPIQISWPDSKITAVGEFVASRGGESNCFIYSGIPLNSSDINVADFENPFCFYDLAGDRDGIPELQIRREYWPAYTPKFMGGGIRFPLEWIRYSWDQTNDRNWDFGLGLAGRFPIETTIELGQYTIRSIPYSIYPTWVTERTWDEAVFVARESGPYRTSEGIYDAQVPRPVIDQYMTGLSAVHPEVELDVLTDPGLRKEYATDMAGPPQLYFSPVDGKLHLKEAGSGYWKIDGERSIEYQDLDDDGYIDHWIYAEGGQPDGELFLAQSHLILTDENKVVIMEVDIPTAWFHTSPPRNTEEWLSLGRQLELYQPEGLLEDLQSMVAQYQGPIISLQAASIRDFRHTDAGFRFVLELQSDFSMQTDSTFASTMTPPFVPGSYLVTFTGREFSIDELTSVSLYVKDLQISGDQGPVEAVNWSTVGAIIGNDGLEDARDLIVNVTLQGPSGVREVISSTVAFLPGEGRESVTLPWAPSEAGDWTVQIAADFDSVGELRSKKIIHTSVIEVSPHSLPPWRWLLTLGDRISGAIVVFLIAISLLSGALVVVWAYQVSAKDTLESGTIDLTGGDK